jgi:hypothetical protein
MLQSLHAHLVAPAPVAAASAPARNASIDQGAANLRGPTAEQIAEYEREGLVVLPGVLGPVELAELRQEVGRILARAPATKGAAVDRAGDPCLGEPGWFQFAPALRAVMVGINPIVNLEKQLLNMTLNMV